MKQKNRGNNDTEKMARQECGESISHNEHVYYLSYNYPAFGEQSAHFPHNRHLRHHGGTIKAPP